MVLRCCSVPPKLSAPSCRGARIHGAAPDRARLSAQGAPELVASAPVAPAIEVVRD